MSPMDERAALRFEVEHAQLKTPPLFGKIYGAPETPCYITPEGPVWMWRKGQRVRFYTAEGVQIGPEHRNVFPAILSASYEGWIDPRNPWLSAACTAEVREHAGAKKS